MEILYQNAEKAERTISCACAHLSPQNDNYKFSSQTDSSTLGLYHVQDTPIW